MVIKNNFILDRLIKIKELIDTFLSTEITPISLAMRKFSSSITSSDDDDKDEASHIQSVFSKSRHTLKAVKENGDSDEDEKKVEKPSNPKSTEDNIYFSDTDEVFTKTMGLDEFKKDYEPLKSVELLRNLEKNLCTYLPKYSLGSDTETGEP